MAGYNSSDFPAGITIAPGDKVIVVGEHDPLFGATAQFAVARLNTDGSLDTTFNSTGEQVISVTGSGYGSGYGEGAIAAAVQADGKIVVAGNYDGDNGQEFAVARLLANGQIDNAQNDPAGNFNGTGYNTMAVGAPAPTTTSRPSRSRHLPATPANSASLLAATRIDFSPLLASAMTAQSIPASAMGRPISPPISGDITRSMRLP